MEPAKAGDNDRTVAIPVHESLSRIFLQIESETAISAKKLSQTFLSVAQTFVDASVLTTGKDGNVDPNRAMRALEVSKQALALAQEADRLGDSAAVRSAMSPK
jgi:hypothetical protein